MSDSILYFSPGVSPRKKSIFLLQTFQIPRNFPGSRFHFIRSTSRFQKGRRLSWNTSVDIGKVLKTWFIMKYRTGTISLSMIWYSGIELRFSLTMCTLLYMYILQA